MTNDERLAQPNTYGDCDECGTPYSFDPTDGGCICVQCLRERLAQPVQDYRTRYDQGCYKCGSHYCPADCPMPTHLVPQPTHQESVRDLLISAASMAVVSERQGKYEGASWVADAVLERAQPAQQPLKAAELRRLREENEEIRGLNDDLYLKGVAFIARIEKLERMNQELLEALKEIEWSNDEQWRTDRARAAIVKHGGGA